MNLVCCLICRQQMQTLKSLTAHYLKDHSKFKIVKQLLKVSLSRGTPLITKHRNTGNLSKSPKKIRKKIQLGSNSLHTETLYLTDNIRILCGQNEIIIGDTKSNIDMEFSFDEYSKEYSVPSIDDEGNIATSDCDAEVLPSAKYKERCLTSTSSEESAANSKNFKKKMKRKKVIRSKMSHYCIDISKMQDLQSLDEKNGYFYTCHCRKKSFKKHDISQKTDLRIITSDTESCSDTSKNSIMPIIDTKIFCSKCGSGYKTETELENHMYVHESFCRLCNISFPCEFSFKQHMQLHIFRIFVCHICFTECPSREMLLRHFDFHMEDHTFETVIDMEEDYKTYRYNFMNKSYHCSINNIICFLSDRSDFYYCSYKLSKCVCSICHKEVHLYDYERHIQLCHSN
nr:uncharacterized protein LOC111510603 [Leptinotarsa decemlineata]XP_023022294.1 uncharacterized protein LOC111510603 [Leptinotarsa decemlineata]